MRRSRTGTDLQFVFGQALRWLRGDIEGRAESRCVEVDVEVIDARVDVIDQGSEHSTLACCRQLGRRFPLSTARAVSRCCTDGSGSRAQVAL